MLIVTDLGKHTRAGFCVQFTPFQLSKSVRSHYPTATGIRRYGSANRNVYQDEIASQCVKVAERTKAVFDLRPREGSHHDGMTMADLIALHREVDPMHLVLDEMTSRLSALREGQA